MAQSWLRNSDFLDIAIDGVESASDENLYGTDAGADALVTKALSTMSTFLSGVWHLRSWLGEASNGLNRSLAGRAVRVLCRDLGPATTDG